ncbi:MAG TPA: chemotaxis response regulator protein-glutamate methylesterase [Candidatus Eisenbacteria bacterium]|nr:chemotaxis response regulator protein-glutamate methylesterase [Candidatus Eisenbacteria bacterium]
MRRIRVLVVDDVSMVRRLVVDALSIDPEVQVVGVAANGREALEKIPAVHPDLLVLDYEMPEMDGLETLIEVRKGYPSIRVIIFSSHTRHGAKVTLDALWHGADDYVAKGRADNVTAATQLIRTQLLPKIKALCSRLEGSEDGQSRATEIQAAPRPAPRRTSIVLARAEIVAIGASTGGPRALATLFEGLPSDFPAPIVIVQHMPPIFTRLLAERLGTRTSLPCAEGADGATLRGGQIWIAPGDHHMVLERDGTEIRIRLTSDPPVNSCRPAVDPLFRSVAEIYGSAALGVVLTGMGQDGYKGCERIRELGGAVVVQDEASSVVWGMPGIVARSGLADKIVPLEEVAGEIVRYASLGKRRKAPVG